MAQQKQDLRKENGQLQKEIERLREIETRGCFGCLSDVEPEDFHAFAVIMALGNRNAARKHLETAQSTFYGRLKQWKSRKESYHKMLEWIRWRKAVGRKIKLRMRDPNDSGRSGETAGSPKLLEELLDILREPSNRDYPALLRQVLEVLMRLNPTNCERIRGELVDWLKCELSQ